jgi:hypothetical protein
MEPEPRTHPRPRNISPTNAHMVRQDHGPGETSQTICRSCGQQLPCDALVLAHEVERIRAAEINQQNEIAVLEQRIVRQRRTVFSTLDRVANIWMGIALVGILADGQYGMFRISWLDGSPLRIVGFSVYGMCTAIKGILQRQIEHDADRLHANARIAWGLLLFAIAVLGVFGL